MSDDDPPSLRIALVGPCASGKSTLANGLKAAGYQVKQPAQEHSYVLNMWQRLTKPDILIYLDLDFKNLQRRRPKNHGGPERLAEQHQRLIHAYKHCDLYIDTSDITPVEIQKKVFAFLERSET
jgi:deoxyadenosine/deoxycytidine kinase